MDTMFNSSYWKSYKKSLPNKLPLFTGHTPGKQSTPVRGPQNLFDICIGCMLGDSTQYVVKNEGAKLKFEQGYKHKAYVEEQWNLFPFFLPHIRAVKRKYPKGQKWTFYVKPKEDIRKTGKRAGLVHRYYFRTFSHPAFRPLKDIFLDEQNKKVYKNGTITKYLSPQGLCYWVADDGSQQKNNEVIQNSQGFTKKMNEAMSQELNKKFNLHSKVVGNKYWAIYIPASDAPVQRELLSEQPPSMIRKQPKLKNKHKRNPSSLTHYSSLA